MSALLRRSGALLSAAAAGLSLSMGVPAFASEAPPARAPRTFAACAEPACGSRSEHGNESWQPPQRARRVILPPGTKPAPDPLPCPPDREELGRATWTLLHTTAAYYPETPNTDEQEAARGLIRALSVLYPCVHCRAGLAADVAARPPNVESRSAFSAWVCALHNNVSAELGNTKSFPCELAALDARWRTGTSGCIATQESLGRYTGDDAAEDAAPPSHMLEGAEKRP